MNMNIGHWLLIIYLTPIVLFFTSYLVMALKVAIMTPDEDRVWIEQRKLKENFFGNNYKSSDDFMLFWLLWPCWLLMLVIFGAGFAIFWLLQKALQFTIKWLRNIVHRKNSAQIRNL